MPTFQYTALQGIGPSQQGVLTAASRGDALTTLQQQSLIPIVLQEVATSSPPWRRRVHRSAMIQLYAGLADLLESGVPLLRSLEILATQVRDATLRHGLEEIREQVANGAPLAEAFRSQPRMFDTLAIDLIAVGEEAGCLEQALQRVAMLAERQAELRGRIAGALIYPAFLMIVGFVVGCGMFLFFVPIFEPLFERMRERGELPWATQGLLRASSFMRNAWGPMLAGFVALALALRMWSQSTSGRLQCDRWLLCLPAIGPILRDMTLSRFSYLLGVMLANGIPLLRALDLALQTLGNQYLANALQPAREAVAEGGSLATTFRQCSLIPAEYAESVAIAEQANRLEQVLQGNAERLERRANKNLEVMTKMLEPVLMTLLAGMIGFLIIALLLPIFATSGRLQ